jgi:hypothetical protein
MDVHLFRQGNNPLLNERFTPLASPPTLAHDRRRQHGE